MATPTENAPHPDFRHAPSDVISYLGVVVMALLVVLIVSLGIVGMRAIQDSSEQIVTHQLRKLRLLQEMSTASRERTDLLQRMVVSVDPFARDQLALEFNIRGTRFASARAELLTLELTAGERRLIEQQGEFSREAVVEQMHVLDLLAGENFNEARRVLAEFAIPLQYRVFGVLSELMDFQTLIANDSVQRTRLAFEHGRTAILVMAIVAILVSVLLYALIRKAARLRQCYLEQVEAANRAKSAFLAKMSHEMRTPLSSIIGFAEMSMDSDQTMDERISALRTIHSSGQHLLGLINDILDLSKIEAQKLEVEFTEVPLTAICADVTALLRVQAESKGLDLKVNCAYPLPRTLRTDALRLKQILINLGGNAVKFTERGHVTLNVRYDRLSNALELEVEDSGIGIEPEALRNLFQDFQQADATITRKYGGTGLGLSVSQKLAHLLGGRITVTSTPGVGSRFKLAVTCAQTPTDWVNGDSAAVATRQQNQVATSVACFRGRVLVADDTPTLRDLVALYLRHAGVDVTTVENGRLAVERAAREKFDLVLMDIRMPELDGVDAMRELRAAGYTIPVVAVSANAMKEDQTAYLDAGFSGFLVKPIVREQLLAVLDRYLKRADPGDSKEAPPIAPNYLDPDDEHDAAIQSVIENFVARLPDYCTRIRAHIRNRDWLAARELSHQLQGMGSAMGYPQVTEVAAAMSFQFKAENMTEAERLNARFENITARIMRGRAASPARTGTMS